MSGLNVRQDPSELDFLSLGALVHRLDPGVIPFRKARSVEIHVSGGEYNVAANLSDCFGLKTAVATAMVKYPIGELVQGRVRETGVTPYYKWFEHDGVRGPNIATVYSDRGHGVRAPVVFYNRSNEAAAHRPGDFDSTVPLRTRRPLVPLRRHLLLALRDDLRADHRGDEGREGRRRDHLVRPELPRWPLGVGRRRREGAAGHQADRLTPRRLDRQRGETSRKGLGITGPDVHSRSKLDPETFFTLIDRVVQQHPNIKLVATTLREVHSTNRHDWAAVLWLDGKRYVSPTCQLDVIDRIGGGDGFAAGLIYGLLTGRPPEEALRLGWAHGALLTTFPGDVTMAKLGPG